MPKKTKSWLNEIAMRESFEPTKEKAVEQLIYILLEDRNSKTVVPKYFIGKEKEMLDILAGLGIKARVYCRQGEMYVTKEEDWTWEN